MIGDYLRNMAGRAELLARVETLDERCGRHRKLLEECRALLGPQWPQVELVDVPGRLREKLGELEAECDRLRAELAELAETLEATVAMAEPLAIAGRENEHLRAEVVRLETARREIRDAYERMAADGLDLSARHGRDRRRLRAELAERHSDLEAVLSIAITDHCPCCGEPWGESLRLSEQCPAWVGNGGPCDSGTALACCKCLCGEDEVSQ